MIKEIGSITIDLLLNNIVRKKISITIAMCAEAGKAKTLTIRVVMGII